MYSLSLIASEKPQAKPLHYAREAPYETSITPPDEAPIPHALARGLDDRHWLCDVGVCLLQGMDELQKARMVWDEMPAAPRHNTSVAALSLGNLNPKPETPLCYPWMWPLLTCLRPAPPVARAPRHTRTGCPCGQGSGRGGCTCPYPCLQCGYFAAWSAKTTTSQHPRLCRCTILMSWSLLTLLTNGRTTRQIMGKMAGALMSRTACHSIHRSATSQRTIWTDAS